MWISSKHHGRGCETQTSSTQRKLSVFDSELCQHNITSVHSWVTLFHSESSSAVTLCSEKVLTLSHSGRWNTLGGRARLNPCAHTQRQRKKKTASSVSLLLFPVPLTAFMNCPSLHTFVSFVLTLKPGVHLLLPSHCLSVCLLDTSHQQPPTPAGCFEVFTVVTRVSKQSMERSATTFDWPCAQWAEQAADWLPFKPMRGGLSQEQVGKRESGCNSF